MKHDDLDSSTSVKIDGNIGIFKLSCLRQTCRMLNKIGSQVFNTLPVEIQ